MYKLVFCNGKYFRSSFFCTVSPLFKIAAQLWRTKSDRKSLRILIRTTSHTHAPLSLYFCYIAALLEEQLQYMGKKAVKIQRRSICVHVVDACIAQSLALFGLAAAFALHEIMKPDSLVSSPGDGLSVAHVFTTVCALT